MTDCSWVLLRPPIAMPVASERLIWKSPDQSVWRLLRRPGSALQTVGLVDHLVRRLHDLGVGRVGALGGDQRRQLLCEVDVRAFERSTRDSAGRAGIGIPPAHGAGLDANLVGIADRKSTRLNSSH